MYKILLAALMYPRFLAYFAHTRMLWVSRDLPTTVRVEGPGSQESIIHVIQTCAVCGMHTFFIYTEQVEQLYSLRKHSEHSQIRTTLTFFILPYVICNIDLVLNICIWRRAQVVLYFSHSGACAQS